MKLLKELLTVKSGFSWLVPYWVGFMFTMGIWRYPFEIVGFWNEFAAAIITFIIWPYLLGLHYLGL